MRESCGGQSLSILDWQRREPADSLETAQFLMFVNAADGMRELFLAGGAEEGDAGEFAPEWKQQYEKAKEAMRQDCEKVFRSIPIFAYAGTVSPTAEVARLQGFTVVEGAMP
jgi:hypothetical protein